MRSSFPLARSQSFSVLSALPESAVRPSGAMATLTTPRECPVKVRSSFPLARSQSFSVLSAAPRERGSAVRGNGDADHPVGVPGEGAKLFSVARSQSFSVLSALPESAVRPSGAMATLPPPPVPGEGAQLFSAGQVPELQRLVRAPRERGSAVRGNGDAVHRIGVPGETQQRKGRLMV